LFVFGVKKELVKEPSLYELTDSWFKWPIPKYANAEMSYDWGEPEGRNL